MSAHKPDRECHLTPGHTGPARSPPAPSTSASPTAHMFEPSNLVNEFAEAGSLTVKGSPQAHPNHLATSPAAPKGHITSLTTANQTRRKDAKPSDRPSRHVDIDCELILSCRTQECTYPTMFHRLAGGAADNPATSAQVPQSFMGKKSLRRSSFCDDQPVLDPAPATCQRGRSFLH